jgi:hypothetical protein
MLRQIERQAFSDRSVHIFPALSSIFLNIPGLLRCANNIGSTRPVDIRIQKRLHTSSKSTFHGILSLHQSVSGNVIGKLPTTTPITDFVSCRQQFP